MFAAWSRNDTNRFQYIVRLIGLSLISATVVTASAARAEVKNVRIMMDWIIQGTHAPFFIAQERGYYKAEGVTVDAIDAGKIRCELGWAPRHPFEEGLEATARWYLDHRDWCDAVQAGRYDRERLGLGG